ncbi:MAG TPA: hypothetical protein VK838_05930, partial [Candidatus Limnocylindrales bacterium]|nr:hypothetical protein [Candidatus Limnocylindrales bacterium]
SKTSFTLTDSFGFSVPAQVRWNSGQLKAILIPSRQLVPREWYTARLSGAIRSADGVPLATFSWRFRTKNDGDGIAANWPKTKRLAFRQGTHTAYQFDANGRVTSVKTSTLPADSGANTSTRRMLPNQSGYWFYVTNGLWAGHWIRQSDALYLADDPPGGTSTADQAFDPAVRLTFLKGTHTGYKFDSSGQMLAQKTYTLSRNSGADASSLEAIPNQTGSWFKIVNGVWADYWIRASDVVFLP